MSAQNNVDTALKELRKSFAVSTSDLRKMISSFHDEMQLGLRGKTSSLKMLPSFIDCPTGEEAGTFIGVDLGGTNLRVIQVRLFGGSKIKVEQISTYPIPRKITRGKGQELFDFIASSISDSVQPLKNANRQQVSLGFAFSFPVQQTAIDKGTLIDWTKGFTATGVVNYDVVELFRQALQRKGVRNMHITALTNDTVGTLLAKGYASPDCDMGVIFGTGTNACYREREKMISRLQHSEADKKMIVNIEWGNFNRLPVNACDQQVDKGSRNPGAQRLEKMISGLYLGEIARHAVRDLIKKSRVFADQAPKFRKGRLRTEDMAAIEKDRTTDLGKVQNYLAGLGIESSVKEREILQQVCRVVSRRAARISAAAISAVITWMDPELRQNHIVAVDGTLYAKYPQFKQNIIKTLQQLHDESSGMITLSGVKDGSGVGAAVAAAVAGNGK